VPFYILAIVIFLFVAAHLILRPRPSANPFTISHRGAKGLAPENTLLAVREAVSRRAAYTEIDIRRAADGALVVMHDLSLRRTTGHPANVDDLTSAEIAQLTVRTERGIPPAEDTVPLFETVLDYVAAQAVTLVVEVKDPVRYPEIARQVADMVRSRGLEHKVLVGSFDHAWLHDFHAAAPDVPLTPIADWWTRIPAQPPMRYVDVDWLRVVLDPTFVRRMRRQGRQVLVWTVDTTFVMRLMLWLGVDGITTNRPDLAREVLGD
jgi:glycerophosphoryl diester phosphodiesterase